MRHFNIYLVPTSTLTKCLSYFIAFFSHFKYTYFMQTTDVVCTTYSKRTSIFFRKIFRDHGILNTREILRFAVID